MTIETDFGNHSNEGLTKNARTLYGQGSVLL